MERSHTQIIRDSFYDMEAVSVYQMWQNLGDRIALIQSGKWKEYYEKVVSQYKLSSRFAFMRILFEKETGLPLPKIDEQVLSEGFSVEGIGHFSEISIRHAEEMDETEVHNYERLLLRRVAENNPEYVIRAQKLIPRAMSIAKDGAKSHLNRAEIIQLGHMANFSLEEIQFILLRVLGDNEAGLSFSASSDIIDMYGFIVGAKLVQVEKLKQWYEKNCAHLPKDNNQERAVYYTHNIANTVEHTFYSMDIGTFKEWLYQKAPTLDARCRITRKVYMNLAAYTYDIVSRSSQSQSNWKSLCSDMEELAAHWKYSPLAISVFGANCKPTYEKCALVSETLAYENAEFATNFGDPRLVHQKKEDATLFHEKNVKKLYKDGFIGETIDENWFHFPFVTKKGTIKLSRCRQRMLNIFLDLIQPTKSDLLYLLWITAILWAPEEVAAQDMANYLDDFLASASCLLEAAMLPDFYPPNILEETILLSLVLQNKENNPAVVYEEICTDLVKSTGAGMPSGKKKKTTELQQEIAEWYYAHETKYRTKTDCKKACADLYKIGLSTVENYCRKFPKEKRK